MLGKRAVRAIGSGKETNGDAINARVGYRKRLYSRYVSSGQATVDASRSLVASRQQILERLPPDRSARIVDIGCGNGALMTQIREAGYRHVMGVDTSAEQVVLAQKHGVNGIVQADLLEWMDNTREPFDAVVAVDLLEHFDPCDVLGVLDRVWKVLVPGGRVIIRTPNAEGPFGSRYRYGDLTHGLAFTSQSMKQVLLATGFDGIEIFDTPPVAHGAKSLLRVIIWRAIDAALRLYLTAEVGTAAGAILTQNLVAVAIRPGIPGKHQT
jgi:2-polyprenyl-3-methyl-5-hydroxy-6-metoxy-1,4-benzoquinol methylase